MLTCYLYIPRAANCILNEGRLCVHHSIHRYRGIFCGSGLKTKPAAISLMQLHCLPMHILINPVSDFDREFRTVLIVDDTKEMADVLAEQVAASFSNVLAFTCYDPRIALEFIKHIYLDMIICDIDMPHIKGNKIIDAIKQMSPTTYTVTMTAHGAEMGFLAGLSKPDFFIDKSQAHPDVEKIVSKGLSEALERRENIISIEDLSDNNGDIHWRERIRICKKLGFQPGKYLLSRRKAKGVAAAILKHDLPKKELAQSAGFSTFQKMRSSIDSVLNFTDILLN